MERWKCTNPNCWCRALYPACYGYSLLPSLVSPGVRGASFTEEEYIKCCELLHKGPIRSHMEGLQMLNDKFPGNTWRELEGSNE